MQAILERLMNQSRQTIPALENQNREFHQAGAQASALLDNAAKRLQDILKNEPIIMDTPLEAEAAMKSVLQDIRAAIRQLKPLSRRQYPSVAPPPGGPTRQQGQFLAFIREYMMRNVAGVAPTHASMQRFFNLTAPSVNSMVVRLERRGFIRHIPGKARGIELALNPALIPPLDRPFKF